MEKGDILDIKRVKKYEKAICIRKEKYFETRSHIHFIKHEVFICYF